MVPALYLIYQVSLLANLSSTRNWPLCTIFLLKLWLVFEGSHYLRKMIVSHSVFKLWHRNKKGNATHPSAVVKLFKYWSGFM